MATVIFSGKLFPEHLHVEITEPFVVNETSREGEQRTYTISIANGVVSVSCDVAGFDLRDEELGSFLYARARVYGQTVLNVIALKNLHIATFVPDKLTFEGRTHTINLEHAHLAGVWTAPQPEGELLHGAVNDPNVMLALDDLMRGTENVMLTELNCARAIEGLRKSLTPGSSDDVQWNELRRRLNLERSFIDPVMDRSKGPRHGQRVAERLADMHDIRRRSWTIMSRFFELRLRGLDQLTQSDFPLLT